MKIFCSVVVSDNQKKWLQNNLKALPVIFQQDMDEVEGFLQIQECEVVFGNPPLQWLQHPSKIKWIQLESVGLDPYQKIIAQGEIAFSNAKGFFSKPVAETVLAGILTFYRKIHSLGVAQNNHQWMKNTLRYECRSLEGKKVLILGAGSIGQMIKRYLEPFGCDIMFYDTYNPFSDFSGLDDLDSKLANYDVLIGCLPETDETKQMINGQRLSQMKKSAVIINVGRGSLIDEGALMKTLREGQLLGAFLDVTAQEPLPKNSLLWSTPNLLLSQHTGGGTIDEVDKKLDFFIDSFQKYVEGTPKNVVKI